MLAKAEAILAVELPVEFVELLRIQNGGYTKGFAHPMSQKTTWAKDHVPFEELAGIVTDASIESCQNILRSAEMATIWGVPPRQVLLCGDGHYWITLDYRNGLTPSVAWIDVECGEDFQVAESFGAFLSGLVPASFYDAG
jgi:hypothetical protein